MYERSTWDYRSQNASAQETTWRSRLLSLVTITIWVAMVIWGFQLHFGQKHFQSFSQEYEQNRRANIEMSVFCDPIQTRASHMGLNYSPQQLFADRRAIQLENRRLGYPTTEHGTSIADEVGNFLQEKVRLRAQLDFKLDKAYWSEWAKFDAWKAKYCPDPPTGREDMATAFHKAGWSGVGHWAFTFQWRSMLLGLLLWPVLLKKNGKPVIATILADKKAFVVAAILPYYGIFVYPRNVVREVIAEAEYRRAIEQLLIPLSFAERLWVRERAASPNYHQWRKEYRLANAGLFRHSFAAALLATLLLMVVLPLLAVKPAEASSKRSRPVFITVRAGPTVQLAQGEEDGSQATDLFIASGDGLVPPPTTTVSPTLLLWSLPREMMQRLRQAARDVIHVPLYGCLVVASSFTK